jgi:acetyltransferase-like isoleucine patch superfamily enzyme
MRSLMEQIQAAKVVIEDNVTIGANSIIRGEQVVLKAGVLIGDNVDITCDGLEMGVGARLGSGSTIVCPNVICEDGSSIGDSLHVELNQHLRLGQYARMGHDVSMLGQGFEAGAFLWMEDNIIVGGGGARDSHSYLTIGERSMICTRCFINLSEGVTIGNNVGVSFGVVLLTHGAWDPVLGGYPARFAPIHIGDYATILTHSVVLPGVNIGEHSLIGAGSIVNHDIPAHSLAAGNPARIIKGPGTYPPPLDAQQTDSLVRAILANYLATLVPKGVRILADLLAAENHAVVEFENQQETIRYVPICDHPPPPKRGYGRVAPMAEPVGITLALGPVPQESAGRCHFDLDKLTMTGEPSRISEDLRDYLRRRGIRIFTGKPFVSIPLANLHRLQLRRRG